MKKAVIGFIGLLGLASVTWGQNLIEHVVGPFGTLNNTDNSIVIPSNNAQDLLNVNFSPGGLSVKKRKGYGEAFSLTITTSAVHGVHKFYEAGGNDVALFFNDRYMEASVAGGNVSVIMSSGTLDAVYRCVDSQGWAYCANDNNDPIVKTDGTTFTTLVTPATGTTLAVMPTRLAMAGFTDYPNRIDFSEEVDFTDWTVAGECTDPINYTIVAPGSGIKHITYACDQVIWFKEESFGYVMEGPCHGDWVTGTISPNLGTLDNESVYVNGILYFRGNDGHFYAYDCANLVNLSRDIQETVDLSQPRRSNYWEQTSATHWDNGTFNENVVYVDTETRSGDLTTTFPDYFNELRDGTGGEKSVWVEYTVGGSGTGDVTTYGGYLEMDLDGGTLERIHLRTVEALEDFDQGTTYYTKIHSMPTDSGHLSDFYLTLATNSTTSAYPSNSGGSYWELDFESTTTGKAYLLSMTTKDVNGTGTVCTSCSDDQDIPMEIYFYISTDTYQITLGSDIVASGSHGWANDNVYLYFSYLKGSSGAGTLKIDTFNVIPQTFTYLSPVNSAASLVEWDNFEASRLDLGGNHDFYIRASTGEFSVNSTTPTWTAITPGDKPSISTGSYVQVKDFFNYTSPNLKQLDLYNFTVKWFEGVVTELYGEYHDDSIWWSLVSGAGGTTNNRILLYDMINRGWTLYDIAANGFMIRSEELYFGDASEGYIHKYGTQDDDNGETIEAYWQSKDFIMGNPFVDKEIRAVSVAGASISGSSVTVTYTIDGSSSTEYDVDLYDPNKEFTRNNRILPVGSFGSTVNFKFGNNVVDSPFEIFAIQYGIRPKPWRPTE